MNNHVTVNPAFHKIENSNPGVYIQICAILFDDHLIAFETSMD